MTFREAIKVIRSNWPPERYTSLREALTIAIELTENEKDKEDSWGKYPDARDIIGEEANIGSQTMEEKE